ncbi:hypothetical protein BGW39_004562 [Mortierella sp. 14UC]|nr:hypothetical protein BGW39_004562 [Mortierella sp. 14UC]
MNMSPIVTPGQDDDDDILDGDDEDEEEDEDDPRLHLLLHEEEGYLSDLSAISNEGIIMAADDSTLRDTTSRESASRRLMRRAISLEDLNTVSAIHHNHNYHHMLGQDSPPVRPSSSASMSLPVPSDTLPSLLPDNQTLYQRYYHHRSLERPSNYNALLSDDNTQYSLYRLDHDQQGPVRAMSPDADLDDPALMDDAKSTYTTNQVLQDHSMEVGKDETVAVAAAGGPLGWLNTSPLLEALVNWVEGPPNRPQPKKNPNEKPNPILEIPFQFIALLTYPEPDPKAGDKMSLAMVRESAFVRQRRKTLMMLTAYTLVVRYCSFDFFLVVLFASNCGMLFLMKNSGRMNVNMAKRAVGQRVGWAKQWAGGLFKRGNSGMISNNHSYINGNDTMSIHQGITTSNASSSKSLPHISSAPAESIRGVSIAASMAGEKADGAQENSPQIKRRGLFGKRKTYTTSLAPSQGVGSSSLSILSPTSATGDGLNGDDVSVMTGRTKRGFFKRNTNSSTNRSATAPPPTTLDTSPTPATAKHSNNSSTSTTATAAILTSKNGTPMLSTSPQPQNQSFSQLDFILPARSPSPSALRKEVSSNGNKAWSITGSVSSGVVAIATGTPPLQSGQATGAITTLPINSSVSSGSPSPNSSPKSAAAANPAAAPATSNTTTTATTSVSTGRSLASAINPRSLLSSFTSQSLKQQQQTSATSPVTPTFPHHSPSIITTSIQGMSSIPTVPISPRPIKAAGPRTGFLTGSLSTTKLSSVLSGGRGSTDLGNASGGRRGSASGGGVYEEEERLEVTMEYQLQQHHQQLQFNPHRRASTTSNVGAKYSTLSSSSSSSMVSPSSPSPQEIFFREHHLHPFAMSGQDHFQQQLQFQHQQQGIHPMWQISSAGGGMGAGVGDGMVREFIGRGSIGGGSGGMMKEDLLDPVTSAAADAMEGFDREA